uniref:Uncharacterized protein n=1 Tax=uncultured bacterium BAC25G1 TaxID=1329523 RepID=R4JCW8_9BACT|nr:hypothetical protein metaSSY_00730 [uncultured bacterium BAC25G1]
MAFRVITNEKAKSHKYGVKILLGKNSLAALDWHMHTFCSIVPNYK